MRRAASASRRAAARRVGGSGAPRVRVGGPCGGAPVSRGNGMRNAERGNGMRNAERGNGMPNGTAVRDQGSARPAPRSHARSAHGSEQSAMAAHELGRRPWVAASVALAVSRMRMANDFVPVKTNGVSLCSPLRSYTKFLTNSPTVFNGGGHLGGCGRCWGREHVPPPPPLPPLPPFGVFVFEVR